jgi:glycosyltransferase involved in cell wall biosynthesis
VFTYFSFKEGFGLPPLEAMACGTPVVVSSTSSLPEVCGDAVEYVDPTNVDDMYRGLSNVLADEQLRIEMIQRGKRRAQSLTWGRTATEVMTVLEKTAGLS